MGRKDLKNDIALVSQSHFKNISGLQASSEGFSFHFRPQDGGPDAKIDVLVQEESEYPRAHSYIIFADESAPAEVATAIDDLDTFGKTVAQLLSSLSKALLDTMPTGTGREDDPFTFDSDGDVEMPDSQVTAGLDEQDSDDDDVDNQDWALDDDYDGALGLAHGRSGRNTKAQEQGFSMSRVRADLLTAKAAGFKIGHLGTFQQGNSCYVSVSCRVAKLGISEEAMQAWLLEPSDYLVLLLYYPSGYRSLDILGSLDIAKVAQNVNMRVGISSTYKPATLTEAQHIFGIRGRGEQTASHEESMVQTSTKPGFRDCFISRPLNDLLGKRLIPIVRYRLGMQLSWSGAEKFYHVNQGRDTTNSSFPDPSYSLMKDDHVALPQMVEADEIAEPSDPRQLSFPLIAVQFLLRHFVRCTEFCLVCHCRLDTQVEAIKPYVCDDPLCLYQYMNLGFGPSIEHEIISQPYVVDLLISFCYAGSGSHNKRNYPEGLGLIVPHPYLPVQGFEPPPPPLSFPHGARGFSRQPEITSISLPEEPSKISDSRLYEVKFDACVCEILFDKASNETVRLLRAGNWVVINSKTDPKLAWHCQVRDVSLYPTVKVSQPLLIDKTKNGENSDVNPVLKPPPAQGLVDVTMHIYNINFDELDLGSKARSLRLLLDLLPSVNDMRNYLIENPNDTLSKFAATGKMCPASLELLRWIIASNRSCIFQVDQPETKDMDFAIRKSEERVQGLQGLMQFRFAMGAPDKEQRFVSAINSVTANTKYPTMFAWHGSPLSNWHSIIREGLNFDRTINGRAYGDGCYHSKHYGTSQGFVGGHYGADTWPQSMLRITSAIALSEIVNAPSQFTSTVPHYVVAQLDWIQTRYLFVSLGAKITLPEDREIANYFPQDPAHTPTGPKSTPLVLPITAVPKSRRPALVLPSNSGKKPKLTSTNLSALADQNQGDLIAAGENDAGSVMTDVSDLEMLFEGEARPATPPPEASIRKPRQPSEPLLHFIRRPLTDLPLLPPPPYATSKATRRLQQDFRNFQKIQEGHIKADTLFEFGLFADPDHLVQSDNLYQWIIEMHSFPMSLPLAKDMQANGIQSIVFELRFHKDYPYVPPFVRVIRPRFLPFAHGGGGHVTAGGSICMDMLTNSGWSSVYSIEGILVQIRSAIMSTDPRPARLDRQQRGVTMDYNVGEAVDAFVRAARMHDWKVPEDVHEMMMRGPVARELPPPNEIIIGQSNNKRKADGSWI